MTDEIRRAAEFRAALRAFQRRSDEIVAANGLTPQRYLLLLMIKGAPDGREHATVTELSERLLLAQNTVTELVGRMEQAGLLEREPSTSDRRVSYLHLSDEAERRLEATVAAHGSERLHMAELLRALS